MKTGVQRSVGRGPAQYCDSLPNPRNNRYVRPASWPVGAAYPVGPGMRRAGHRSAGRGPAQYCNPLRNPVPNPGGPS